MCHQKNALARYRMTASASKDHFKNHLVEVDGALLKRRAKMMTVANRVVVAVLAVACLALAGSASAETLFKIITAKDEIVVGLNDAELSEFGGDAGGIARAMAAKGSLSLWQYAVTQKDGERMVAPLQKIGVLANASLRVEPYKQPFKVLPHQ
jgi:hypothetical protein